VEEEVKHTANLNARVKVSDPETDGNCRIGALSEFYLAIPQLALERLLWPHVTPDAVAPRTEGRCREREMLGNRSLTNSDGSA
jgi:hypothetical protein